MLHKFAVRAYITARPFVGQAGKRGARHRRSKNLPKSPEQPLQSSMERYLRKDRDSWRKLYFEELARESDQGRKDWEEIYKEQEKNGRLQYDLGQALVELTCARANMNPLSALEIIAGNFRAHIPFKDRNDVQRVLDRIVAGELDISGHRTYAAARDAIIDRFSNPDLHVVEYPHLQRENPETDPERAATASLIDTTAKTLHAAFSRRIASKLAPGYDTPCVRIRERSEAEVRVLERRDLAYYEDDDPEYQRWGCEPMYRRGCTKAEILTLCTLTRAEGMALCTFLRFADLNIGVDYSTADGKGFRTFWYCPWYIK
ncbi:hypothetical protein MVEN_00229300 [Mycena venus]|uniref:Uncharacterized protein n=1 Tax=Mycena venus TaxID=2733690 RepID=A0A8H7DC62_9AGAR|nr:hypothetical protein MVEN_00229300 [Mycena venus]